MNRALFLLLLLVMQCHYAASDNEKLANSFNDTETTDSVSSPTPSCPISIPSDHEKRAELCFCSAPSSSINVLLKVKKTIKPFLCSAPSVIHMPYRDVLFENDVASQAEQAFDGSAFGNESDEFIFLMDE